MGRIHDEDYAIRMPLTTIQLTEPGGSAWPLAFDWEDEGSGEKIRGEIEDVHPCMPHAEQKCGAVGDRYECVINGQLEHLYYTILQPRKWFRLKLVSEAEYRRITDCPANPSRVKTRRGNRKCAAGTILRLISKSSSASSRKCRKSAKHIRLVMKLTPHFETLPTFRSLISPACSSGNNKAPPL